MGRTICSLVLVAVALSGCAAMTHLTSDVSSYSRWPAERKPASYTFERLPSQESRPDAQQVLENAARPALEGAGFTPAADPANAEYVVQVGARVDARDRWPYYDPFWWPAGGYYHGGYGRYGRGYYVPGYWPYGWGYGGSIYTAPMPTYTREVAVLVRDRRSGTPLYEARASSEGVSPEVDALLPAMFGAAMKDFPNGGVNPRRITTPLAQPQ
jgi:hypothetical protein